MGSGGRRLDSLSARREALGNRSGCGRMAGHAPMRVPRGGPARRRVVVQVTDRCECGLTYQAFRSIRVADYGDAYHQIAWTREHVSRTAVLRHWAQMKREDWAYHVDTCGWGESDGPLPVEGDASFDVASFAPSPDDGWDEWGGDPLPAPGCPTSPESTQDTPKAVQTPGEPAGARVVRVAPRPLTCDRSSRGRAIHRGHVRWVRCDGNAVGGVPRSAARGMGESGRGPVLPSVRGPPGSGHRPPASWNHGPK